MDPLRTMFRHHAWATRMLIDHCASLPPESMAESAPGTRGPIMDTLVHLLAADQRYLVLMDGLTPNPRIHETEPATLDDLRAGAEAQAARWNALVDRAPELDVTIPARGQWPDTPHAEDLLFLQAIHHGNDHRTQICTILGAHGLEVPDLDGWAYWPGSAG
ncbi:MAG TPA: DinB family protein [Candidatus Dormibacteraeota bacterium]|nr:DinB family protein [Candidatus Dormibacteraeota bacterium]